jgi:uncharacterized membrane protein
MTGAGNLKRRRQKSFAFFRLLESGICFAVELISLAAEVRVQNFQHPIMLFLQKRGLSIRAVR